MAAFPVPEIKRVPLESIALTLKVVHNDVKVRSSVAISWSGSELTCSQSFLSRAIDPPDTSAVDKALAVLEELAAIQADGELTALGRHMVCALSDLCSAVIDDVPRQCCQWTFDWARWVPRVRLVC